jgi:adenylate cyclase
MIKIIQQGINPILNQYDYPEINVRIGIDVGESTVKLTGWDTYHTGTNDSYKNGNKSKSNGNHENIFGHDNSRKGVPIIKKPIYDIIGYTVNIATKMTAFAKPNQVVIGQLVYDALDNTQKSTFKRIYIDPKVWDYVSESTGGSIYRIYGSI